MNRLFGGRLFRPLVRGEPASETDPGAAALSLADG
jgi:hypothetical protein